MTRLFPDEYLSPTIRRVHLCTITLLPCGHRRQRTKFFHQLRFPLRLYFLKLLNVNSSAVFSCSAPTDSPVVHDRNMYYLASFPRQFLQEFHRFYRLQDLSYRRSGIAIHFHRPSLISMMPMIDAPEKDLQRGKFLRYCHQSTIVLVPCTPSSAVEYNLLFKRLKLRW